MTTLPQMFQDSVRTGAVTALTTTIAAAVCGQIETGSAVAPLNSVSHIVWGDEASAQEQWTCKYTATGLALNAAAVTSWAAVHELLFGRFADKGDVATGAGQPRDGGQAVLGGAIVSVLAYVTDYHVVPARLTPGFELRLGNRSLLGIYAALALGLAFGSLCRPEADGSKN